MTDLSHSTPGAAPEPRKHGGSLLTKTLRTRKRNAAEKRFRAYGIAAIAAGLVMLAVLVVTIVGKGSGAFQQTFVTLNVELLESKLDKKGNRDLEDIKKVTTFGYAPIIKDAMAQGMDGVFLLGCKHGDDYQCHFVKGSELADIRMKKIGDALSSLALEEERVQQFQVAIDEYDKLPQIIDDFVASVEEMGPNPFKGF